MKNLCLVSLGCPKNLVDSEIMLGLLEKARYRLVAEPKNADVIIVNTCAFIGDAKKEAIDTVLEMAELKNGRCKKLIVTGCLPQRYKDEIAGLFPEVDLFVGTGEYQNIVKLIAGTVANEIPAKNRGNDRVGDHSRTKVGVSKFIHNAKTPRKVSTPKHFAYVKIAEGCFHGCSFCIIPKIRGAFRSRTIADIVAEARALIKDGVKELILIAQDTSSYGRDLRDGSNLAALLRAIENIKGDFWIRVMYAYPTSITAELIDVFASSKKICRYVDVPIQHISDNILKAMRRKETMRDIRNLVGKLRASIEGVVLRTSLITGFPSEGKREFNELAGFVREGWFNHLGAFAYSREEGTFAAKLKPQVSQKIARERQNAIMEIQAEVSLARNLEMVGSSTRVLVDKVEAGKAMGRTCGQAPDIDGVTIVKFRRSSDARIVKTGCFIDVKITGCDHYDLTAEVF